MLPNYIAVVGYPTAGKSTFQRIFMRNHGYRPVDDGRVLRDICKRIYGLTEAQVTTQAGKSEKVAVLGQEWTVRALLGTVGDKLEQMHGNNIMPWITLNDIKRGTALIPEITPEDIAYSAAQGALRAGCYTFGSVRKNQAKYYKVHGGICVEIDRPEVTLENRAKAYSFDLFDRSLVDYIITNPLPLHAHNLDPQRDYLAEYACNIDKFFTALAMRKQ